jgi:hypothetical protein
MNCNKSQEKCQILCGFEQNGLEFGVIFDQGKSYSDKFVSNGNDGYFMRFLAVVGIVLPTTYAKASFKVDNTR